MTESSLNQLCQRVESSSAFLVEHVGQLIKFIQQLSALESCEKADGKGGQHPLLPCTLAAQLDALLCLQARIHLKAMDLLDDLTIFTNELNRLAQQFGHFGQPSAEEHCLKICQPIGFPYMEDDLLTVTDYLKQLVSMLEQQIHRSNEALGFGTEPLAALPKSVEQWLGQRLLVFSSGTGNNNKVPSGVKLPWAVHKALHQLKLSQQQQQQKQKTFEDI